MGDKIKEVRWERAGRLGKSIMLLGFTSPSRRRGKEVVLRGEQKTNYQARKGLLGQPNPQPCERTGHQKKGGRKRPSFGRQLNTPESASRMGRQKSNDWREESW